ncbi:RNA-binding protein [Spiroplasma culicicola]|uniref:Uncharacterized protein n=1 Tax=Spiroplasma culicicola AES-1 TaxID=1276246 RepID=W6A8B9_9MOLU|nr:hypothetical protein [Spiroplasma culicicola]AHI53140.1 hypothetical protein SCULI_v1c08000 [Spiroplasma culicicola AES-1]
MAKSNQNNDLFKYKPSNPRDPKMPSLTLELSDDIGFSNSTNNNEEFEDNFKSSTRTIAIEESIDSQNPKTSFMDFQPDRTEELLTNGSKKKKSGAQSLIAKLKQQVLEKEENETKTKESDEGQTTVVMPDPNSENRLRFGMRPSLAPKSKVQIDAKTKMLNVNRESRQKLTEAQVKKIVNEFKYKVVKITKTEVILKNSKYGFEIYFNNVDNRWWVTALCFEEIWNPKKTIFVSFWSGNTFIGYGHPTLEETINQAHDLMEFGRTGDIVWKDFVTGWNEKTNRFIAGDVAKKFEFKEYQKIIKWWESNKIRILVKQDNVRDYEDLMNETKAKRAAGEAINPLAGIQAKLLDPPRRAQFVFGYPVRNPKYKGKEYDKPENKLYEIGFAYAE